MRFGWMALLWLMGCAGESLRTHGTEEYGFIEGSNHVWVRGPWNAINPSKDIDDVIDQLCPAIMRLPGATLRSHGQEYCGVIYSLMDGFHYASLPSPLGRTTVVYESTRKSCFAPIEVRDMRGRTVPRADFHSHPWAPSPMSSQDLEASNQWYFIRIQLDTKCRIQKLLPYMNTNRPGELYEREGRSWRLIGLIKPEDKPNGYVTPVEGG